MCFAEFNNILMIFPSNAYEFQVIMKHVCEHAR